MPLEPAVRHVNNTSIKKGRLEEIAKAPVTKAIAIVPVNEYVIDIVFDEIRLEIVPEANILKVVPGEKVLAGTTRLPTPIVLPARSKVVVPDPAVTVLVSIPVKSRLET